MLTDSIDLELKIKPLIQDLVLNELPLAVYDPNQLRRQRMPVVSFDIELLEIDDESEPLIAYAAGPVVLDTPGGKVENHLRVTVPIQCNGKDCQIANRDAIRAAYIVETNPELGTHKETLALANA